MSDDPFSHSPDIGVQSIHGLQSVAAKLLGQMKSDAKAAAARENGKRGGRPPGIPQSAETRQKISESKKVRNARTTGP
jgi:hypothetical protein